MPNTPTCWYCPECGWVTRMPPVRDPLAARIHENPQTGDPCYGEEVAARAVDPSNLAALLDVLREAGHDVQWHTATRDGKLHVGRPEQQFVVVVPKEAKDG